MTDLIIIPEAQPLATPGQACLLYTSDAADE